MNQTENAGFIRSVVKSRYSRYVDAIDDGRSALGIGEPEFLAIEWKSDPKSEFDRGDTAQLYGLIGIALCFGQYYCWMILRAICTVGR
jgi:hypothetical protein